MKKYFFKNSKLIISFLKNVRKNRYTREKRLQSQYSYLPINVDEALTVFQTINLYYIFYFNVSSFTTVYRIQL